MPRTGRPRAFDRNAAIDTAMMLFWAQGYEPTSLAQLRESMGGLSSASFYAAFTSKEALFHEVVDRYIRSYGQVTASLKDDTLAPRDAIEMAMRKSAAMQTAQSHPPGCLIMLGASNCSPENRQVEALLALERERNRQGIERHVARAKANGDLPPSTDTVAMARMFSTFLSGMSFEARDGVPLLQIDAAITSLMSFWDEAAG
ncbi:TetR/AcrR family transcriptional regulator [Sphingobium sp. BHU LFT2]|uniref:TetR/AcrR family transcriptional regulator n=1 Tax=Sphingobium sp. BHU LFT2 TaxID=2807634 RepID=UPI001BEAD83C|nr:TetR/AcrR family transcriptional regulator [Sphingobium sp. BHU LFT2]MBT2246033.1 TetR/AcrR family transcriptional regulator [Sphingobium sp. BHU LFT2]